MAGRRPRRHPDMGLCLSCPPRPRVSELKAHRVPERIIQAQIVQALRTVGAAVYVSGTVRPRGDTPGTRQTPGIPDVEAFLPAGDGPSRLLKVEAKASGGRLSPAQAAYRAHCHVASIDHIVGGLDEVLAYLQQHGYIRAAAHYRQVGA